MIGEFIDASMDGNITPSGVPKLIIIPESFENINTVILIDVLAVVLVMLLVVALLLVLLVLVLVAVLLLLMLLLVLVLGLC